LAPFRIYYKIREFSGSVLLYGMQQGAQKYFDSAFNPLNAEFNPICHLLALLGAHHVFHVGGLRVNAFSQTVVNLKMLLSNFHNHWTLLSICEKIR